MDSDLKALVTRLRERAKLDPYREDAECPYCEGLMSSEPDAGGDPTIYCDNCAHAVAEDDVPKLLDAIESFDKLTKERDELRTENARLREALELVAHLGVSGISEDGCAVCWSDASESCVKYDPSNGEWHLPGCFVAEALATPVSEVT
jgi:hypothetical protein